MKNDIRQMQTHEAREAWVIFSGQTDLPWLKILKPGFRHCYILLNDGRHWISIDPLFPFTEIIVHHVPAEFDFPAWLAGRGYQAVPAPVNRKLGRPAPLMIFTCVEAIKRILGLHNWRILTPWQLYKFLVACEMTSNKTKEITHGRTRIRPPAAKTT